MAPQSSVVISTTAATAVPRAYAITVLSDTVFTAVTGGSNLVGFSGVTFSAGTTVFVTGLLSLTLASGAVVVYQK